MTSLEEIENLVKKAEDTINAGNNEYAKHVLLPQIQDAMFNCDDLTLEERDDLMLIIDDHLNKLGLYAGEPVVSLDELRRRPVPPQKPVTWGLFEPEPGEPPDLPLPPPPEPPSN